MKNKNYGKLIFNALVLVISLGLVIYFIFSKDGLSDLLKSSSGLNLSWLFLAALCHMVNSLIDSLLTFQFIRYKYKHISFFDAMKVAMIGHFFSAVTPGASGGQPMQIYAMSKMDIDVGFGTSIMMQKFLIFQTTATIYSFAAILINTKFILGSIKGGFMWLFVILGLLAQLVVMGSLIIFCFWPKLSHKLVVWCEKILRKFKVKNLDKKMKSAQKQIDLFHDCNKELLKCPKLMITAYIETILLLTVIFAVPYCVYRSLNLQGATMLQMISSQAFVTMISSMIPLPGASGAAEYSFSVFFIPFFTPATMKSAILLWRCITYYGTIFVCAPFALITKGHGKAITAIEENYEEMASDDTDNELTEINEETTVQ